MGQNGGLLLGVRVPDMVLPSMVLSKSDVYYHHEPEAITFQPH